MQNKFSSDVYFEDVSNVEALDCAQHYSRGNIIKSHMKDESFLYSLVRAAGLGLPAVYNPSNPMTFYRPVHGLHFSHNRGPFEPICHGDGFGDLQSFEEIMKTPNFKTFLYHDSSINERHNHYIYRFLGQIEVQKALKKKTIKNEGYRSCT